MMKAILTISAIFFIVAASAQTGNPVFLKWKLQPKEILAYNTVMQEIDTANFKDFSVDFGILLKIFEDSTNKKTDEAKKFFSEINKSLKENGLVTKLRENKPGVIGIEMVMKQKDDNPASKKDTTENIIKMMSKLNGNVMLRGAINENGSIQSFYVKNDQKNLIAMFFELPNRQIKVGDSWSLNMNFISMDQNFKCDTSYKKNNVTLIGLKQIAGQTTAIIKYDLTEFVSGDFNNPLAGNNKKTMMKMTYNAIGEFSVDKGRWTNYDGILSLSASGVMTSNTTKKIQLLAE